jgi:hypothetical protein
MSRSKKGENGKSVLITLEPSDRSRHETAFDVSTGTKLCKNAPRREPTRGEVSHKHKTSAAKRKRLRLSPSRIQIATTHVTCGFSFCCLFGTTYFIDLSPNDVSSFRFHYQSEGDGSRINVNNSIDSMKESKLGVNDSIKRVPMLGPRFMAMTLALAYPKPTFPSVLTVPPPMMVLANSFGQ